MYRTPLGYEVRSLFESLFNALCCSFDIGAFQRNNKTGCAMQVDQFPLDTLRAMLFKKLALLRRSILRASGLELTGS